jgi:hypothetical protein
LYVTALEIDHLRCFDHANLELQYAGKKEGQPPALPNINLLLGNNGMGKTTVLRALALAAISPVMPQSGYLPYRLVRRTAEESVPRDASIQADVILHAQDIDPSELKAPLGEHMSMAVKRQGDYESLVSGNVSPSADVPPIWSGMYNDKSPAFLVVGYGASRRVEDSKNFDETSRRKTRLLRYERVAGLFESQIALTPLAAWLPQFQTANPGRYKQTVDLLNRLLPEDATFTGEFENGEYYFEVLGSRNPFAALSDGYRAYIGWIADMLYHICMGAPSGAKLVDNFGLVLVDEIDLHLHPEWQRSVIATIAETLPNIQFVFTTHSPIVAGSLHKENIFVMEPGPSGTSIVRQYDERIYGLNAEKVLLSSYFNLKTTSAEPFVDELRDLSTRAGKGDLKAALAFMEKLSGGPSSSTSENSSDEKSALARPSKTGSPDRHQDGITTRKAPYSSKTKVTRSVLVSDTRGIKTSSKAKRKKTEQVAKARPKSRTAKSSRKK